MKANLRTAVLATALTASAPAGAEDWFRSRLAANWKIYDEVIQFGGKSHVVVVGLQDRLTGNAMTAAIPADGNITWLNYLFICEDRTGKVLNAWKSDRSGATTSDDGSQPDYQPVAPGTLGENIYDIACAKPTAKWKPVEGDVLQAAGKALAGH